MSPRQIDYAWPAIIMDTEAHRGRELALYTVSQKRPTL